MADRRAYIDDAPGERRGVVTLDGRSERLLIERDGEVASERPGATSAARLRRLDRGLGIAFLEMADGGRAAVSPIPKASWASEGALVEALILAAPRAEKLAVARILGVAEGEARLIAPAPSLAQALQAFALSEQIVTGADARDAADAAEAAALAVRQPLPAGGMLSIEPTRALVAVDVDIGAATGADARRLARKVNGLAIAETARLLRLKGLGGLVAIDLAGKGHDGAALSAIAREVFAVDGPEVSLGPISRFGVFELAVPHRAAPVAERLNGKDGQPTLETTILRLLRAIERAAGPGMRMEAKTSPALAEAAAPLIPVLTARIGARFSIRPDAALGKHEFEVSAS